MLRDSFALAHTHTSSPVDSASSGLLADRNGVRCYAARMSKDPEKSVCVFAYAKDEQPTGGCGAYCEQGTGGPNVGGLGMTGRGSPNGTGQWLAFTTGDLIGEARSTRVIENCRRQWSCE